MWKGGSPGSESKTLPHIPNVCGIHEVLLVEVFMQSCIHEELLVVRKYLRSPVKPLDDHH